ncbi:response regulator [Paenibacillus sp. M1]|uniref:Response regulator n=1 Tax=Paenibacillus haidiansis TaxID=1574488 RepID=A0ABU7VLY0_9BACL
MKLRQRVERWIIRITRSMNLRSKIVLFYGLIVFIPTVLLAVGAGYAVLQTVRANYMLTIKEAVRQSAQSIEFRKQSYDLLATRTAMDGELISRLSRDYEDVAEQLSTINYVDRSFLLTSKYLPGIENFRIYHDNRTLTQDGGLLWKPEERMLSGLPERVWYAQRLRSPDTLVWTNAVDDKTKLVVSRKILNIYGDVYGIVYLLLNYNEVFAESFNHPFDGAGEMYIVDGNGVIIASSNPAEIGILLSSSSLYPYWDSQGETRKTIQGMALITEEIKSGWTVAALVHLDRLEEQSKRIMYYIALGIAFFLLLSIFLIMIVLRNVIWRIRKLGIRMMDISEGYFEATVKNRDNDELGELEVMFNTMSGRLRKLVEEHTEAIIKEREQSFKALQAQINPHFIYNSLSLLRWRALDLKDEMQIRTIDALTTFYRLALSNRVNVTRIRDELEHLKAYVEIQQLRYPGRVTIEWQVEPEVLDLYTIKLILQPIVENCYLHGGITTRPHAFIQIAIGRSLDAVRFQIFDNGKGIESGKLERIRGGSYTGTRNGFGMNNIRERLALYFGPEGRFEIDSMEDEWTVVTIHIPVCKESPEIKKGGIMMRALIVDDEPMQIQGLVRHIGWEALGYEQPLTAESGEEALALLTAAPVDVLITDVSMPGMTGIELLARCKADYPELQHLQTVIISGYDEFEFVQEAINLGAKAYVLKPVKTGELEEKLASFRTAAEKKKEIERETVKLKERVTESREVLQERFVKDLLEGWVHSEELLESWRRLLELPPEEWRATLFLFGYDHLILHSPHDAKERIMLSEGLMNCVKLGLSGFSGTYIGKTGADEAAVILLNAAPLCRAKLEKQLALIRDVLQEQYNASVTVGISRECRSWSEIPLLYKEVRHMMANARLDGYGQILYFDRHLMQEYNDFRLREEYIPEIVKLLDGEESDKAAAYFDHAFELMLAEECVSFSYVQAFGMGLISELARRLKRPADTDPETNIRMWQRLIDCKNAEEVKKVVQEYLSEYANMKQKEQTVQRHNLIRRVARHLEEHLRENLTVKQLAEQFHLNPSYLSVLFKKEMGRTISDFVQEARMNKAKELLRDPNVKVYEVAEQVGFQTAAYFTFLFKKLTGLTPQDFRDYHY